MKRPDRKIVARRRLRLGVLMLLIALFGLGLGICRRLVIGESVVYVQGDVKSPGKLPIAFGMTVSDALKAAGNPTSTVGTSIRLVRPVSPWAAERRRLPVDVSAIAKGDPTTNYQLSPGDRLMVYRDPVASGQGGSTPPRAGADDPTQAR